MGCAENVDRTHNNSVRSINVKVKTILGQLNIKKAPGKFGITYKQLKELIEEYVKYITNITS